MGGSMPMLDGEDTLRIIAVAGGLMLGALFLAFLTLTVWIDARRKMRQTAEFEQSRREIAAYIAEGSIAPDDAARLLATGRSLRSRVLDEL